MSAPLNMKIKLITDPVIVDATQTCRVLHAFGTTDYLWHRLIEDFGLPLDIPQNVAPNNLSADEAQEAARLTRFVA